MKISSRHHNSDDTFRCCFPGLKPEKADLYVLILASQGIKSRIEKSAGRFDIHVHDNLCITAQKAVRLYFQENRKSALRRQLEHLPLSSFNSPAAFVIMALMALIHWTADHYGVHQQMVLEYGVSSLYILQGEAFRAVTALFLHADLQHLLGNLAGLLIFAAPFISLSGYGTGPFMLLFTGTCGNMINAWFGHTARLSIGASTSVMAAAGLMAAFHLTHKKNPVSFNGLMPVFAGAALVAMFSHGEQTDIWAHVFGFLSGLLSGIIFFPLNRVFSFPHKERAFLSLTLFLVFCAFIFKHRI